MTDYVLTFDLSDFVELDRLALLTRQEYNLGNTSDWFSTFRGGLYGFYARIHGTEVNYILVHSWIPRPRLPVETEYHLASIFFNMDSALECLTYALNALGHAVMPTSFRDVAARRELAKISPRDVLGVPEANPPKGPLTGYATLFPRTQMHWLANRDLIQSIFELHDVSKHRQTIYCGGMMRRDPPLGFYEALGFAIKESEKVLFSPAAEILLRPDPKAPLAQRISIERDKYQTLEGLAREFAKFINQTSRLALADAGSTIALSHNKFISIGEVAPE